MRESRIERLKRLSNAARGMDSDLHALGLECVRFVPAHHMRAYYAAKRLRYHIDKMLHS